MGLFDNYQKRILNTYSADYKFSIINKSIEYINNKIDLGEFRFFNIGSDIEQLYESVDLFYDYLEPTIVKSINNSSNLLGYSELIIESLLYNPSDLLIFHSDMYNNLNDIYLNYFNNLYDYESYNVIFNYEVNTFNPSNYFKVCYDHDLHNYDHLHKVFFPHIYPLYFLSKSLLNQITTSIKKDIYYSIKDFDIKSKLKLNQNQEYFKDEIKNFIINNIFNGINFNQNYINDIENSIDLSQLSSIFNNYIDKTISNSDFIKFSSLVFEEYIYEFMYKLHTDYGSVTFNIPQDIAIKIGKKITTDFPKISSNSKEFKSISTIAYKYRHDKLQFINMNLAVFSLWVDLIIQNQKEDIGFEHTVDLSEIRTILRSININNSDFIQHVVLNFKNEFINSKTIEIILYKYLNDIIDRFIKSDEFKIYITESIVPSIAQALKTRAPRLYIEIYEHADKIKLYIKHLLIQHIFNNHYLQNSYRDIVTTDAQSVYNFDDFFLGNIISNFYNMNNDTLMLIQQEYSKFVTSITYLFFFDSYIDHFRLIKKYKQIKRVEKIIQSPYR
jgi:hypothetical protein